MTSAHGDDRTDSDLARTMREIRSSDNRQLVLARMMLAGAEETDPELARAIRYCAIPRRIDHEVVGVLMESDGDRASQRVVASLRDLGLLKRRRDGGFAYHDTFRDALLEDWRAADRRGELQAASERLAAHYERLRDAAFAVERDWVAAAPVIRRASPARFLELAGRMEGLALPPVVEVIYHRSLYSRQAGFQAFQESFERFEDDGRLGLCGTVVSVAADFLARPGPDEDPRPYERWMRYYLSRVHAAAGRTSEAEPILRALMHDMAKLRGGAEAGANKLRLWVLSNLAQVLTETDRHREALSLHLESLALSVRTGEDVWNLPVILYNTARLHHLLNEFAPAEAHYRDAIGRAEEVKNSEMVLRSQLALSGLLQDLGDISRAWDVALQATIRARGAVLTAGAQRAVSERVAELAYSREPGLLDAVRAEFGAVVGAVAPPRLNRDFDITYGNLLCEGGQLERAATTLAGAGETLGGEVDRAGDAEWSARLYWILCRGALAVAQGRLDEGGELYDEAIALAAERDGVRQVTALLRRSDVAAAQCRWHEATEALRTCRARASAFGYQHGMVRADLRLASIRLRKGRLERAEAVARQVAPLIEDAHPDLVPRLHDLQGDIALARGDYRRAEECFAAAAEGWQTLERAIDAARAWTAAAHAAGLRGDWRESSRLAAVAARRRHDLEAMLRYRPSANVVAADGDDSEGMRHLVDSHGSDDGELRAARDRFLAAAERPREPGSATAWYHLNLAFAHRLLGHQREALEALDGVLSDPATWTNSAVLYRLLAEWGDEHGRSLLRDEDAERAEKRFRVTRSAVRGRVPAQLALPLGLGHADALLALGRATEAQRELASLARRARRAGDASTLVAIRLRMAALGSPTLRHSVDQVRACLQRQTDLGRLPNAADGLSELALPPSGVRRLFAALELVGAMRRSPDERLDLLGGARRVSRLLLEAARIPPPAAPIALALDSRLIERASQTGLELLGDQLPELANRISGTLGIPVPAISMRLEDGRGEGFYAVELRHVPVASGWADLAPDSSDPFPAILDRLESVCRDHAPELLSLDDAAAMLTQLRGAGGRPTPPTLDGPEGSLRLWRVLRSLLRDGVPVRDLDAIVESFPGAEAGQVDLDEVVERARSTLAGCLPGADGSRRLVDVPAAVEVGLARHVRVVQGKAVLAIPRSEVERHAASLRSLVGGGDPRAVALVVRRRTMRAPVGRFAAAVVPGVPVLSAAEVASRR